MENHSILSIIGEISEALSLENEPKLLLEAALDTLSTILDIDCCWVQLVSLSNRPKLRLVASRGFSPDMQREMAVVDLDHYFGEEVVGLGHKVVMPTLNGGDNHGVSIFEEEGFSSLIAVPITTYRIHGIMGVAYRTKKRLDNDYTELLTVVAGIIGMALLKSMLLGQTVTGEEQQGKANLVLQQPDKNRNDVQVSPMPERERTTEPVPKPESELPQNGGAFVAHHHKMGLFRLSHKAS
ncbi:MAG: GAF domain-containing protein [Chloroflexi bacterium]|nr:GAF domain-containing protein [Chloroflexota bacterium]